MKKESIQKAIAQLKESAKKRKFSQSYDLIVNLKNFNPKAENLDIFVVLPHPRPKQPKIAAFIGHELADQAEQFCDLAITEEEFSKYPADQQKKLAKTYDYFIAQANLMPKIAQTFGKSLGTKGKMPNPKLGCVVPPNANLEPLVKNIRATVRLANKKATNAQCIVGNENDSDDQIIDNILTVYHALLKQLPQEQHNVKNIQLKLTMSKPVTLD